MLQSQGKLSYALNVEESIKKRIIDVEERIRLREFVIKLEKTQKRNIYKEELKVHILNIYPDKTDTYLDTLIRNLEAENMIETYAAQGKKRKMFIRSKWIKN